MRLSVAFLSSSLLVAACGESPEAPRGYEISVAPLTLPGISDACYTLTVYNSTTTFDATTTVWTQDEVCASDYGDGIGSITYVGTCDASEDFNTVELVLEGLWTGGPFDDEDADELVAGDDYINPCTSADASHTCRLIRPCEENEDTLVEFNLTIMRAARQGFFDIIVNFEDIFCSAKADCEDSDGEPLELLFNGQERDSTAVLAFSCSGGEGADTHLYVSDTYIVCDDTTNTTNQTTTPSTHVVARLRPSKGPGNVSDPAADQGLFGYGVYEGRDSLDDTHSAYWNMAIGIDDTFFHGCPAGYMHQGGQCVTCPADAGVPSGLWRNAIKGQCGYCPVGSTYLDGTCLGCANPLQRFYPDLKKCGGDYANGLPWTDAVEFPATNCPTGYYFSGGTCYLGTDPSTTTAPIDPVAATSVPLDPNNPRECWAYAWASASDELWPELQTPDATTFPTVRYRVPLNPGATDTDPPSPTLSCGVNPLNDDNGVVETQYTGVSRPACFENVLTSDWSSPSNTVDTTRYAQFSNFTSHLFVTPLPDQVPPCEYDWDIPFAKGGAPVDHETASEDLKVFAFDDLDADGVHDAGEPLLGNFTFTVMPQSLNAPTGMLEGGSVFVRIATTTSTDPANFGDTHAGNYLVTVTGRPSFADPCVYGSYTTPQEVTWATSPPAPWHPYGTWTTLFTVGGPVPYSDIYVGLDCP